MIIATRIAASYAFTHLYKNSGTVMSKTLSHISFCYWICIAFTAGTELLLTKMWYHTLYVWCPVLFLIIINKQYTAAVCTNLLLK